MRSWLIPTIALLVIGGVGFAAGWAVNEWGDDDTESGVSQTFCVGVADWHAAQEPFLERAGRGPYGSQDVFIDAAAALLPAASSRAEEDVRATLSDVVRTEEEWLSELFIVDDSFKSAEMTSDVAFATLAVVYYDSLEKAEAKRLLLNDLLRQANVLLNDACGLEPLPPPLS